MRALANSTPLIRAPCAATATVHCQVSVYPARSRTNLGIPSTAHAPPHTLECTWDETRTPSASVCALEMASEEVQKWMYELEDLAQMGPSSSSGPRSYIASSTTPRILRFRPLVPSKARHWLS